MTWKPDGELTWNDMETRRGINMEYVSWKRLQNFNVFYQYVCSSQGGKIPADILFTPTPNIFEPIMANLVITEEDVASRAKYFVLFLRTS